jgi:hypothetical protein
VKPKEIDALREQLDCFDHLRVILSILQQGDASKMQTLYDASVAHHILYKRYYRAIMKLHNQFHVLDFWSYWGVLLSCFGPERHHKLFKRVLSFSYNRSGKTALAYDVRLWIQNLELPELYKPYHMMGKVRPCAFAVQCGGEPWNVIAVAGAVTTPEGKLSKGDLLQYDVNGHVQVSFTFGFGELNNFALVAFVWPCDLLPDSSWRKQSDRVEVVTVRSVVGSLPYIEVDGGRVLALVQAS